MTDEVTFHDEGIAGPAVPAVNVKDRHLYAHDPVFAPFYDELGEQVIDSIYEGLREDFWEFYARALAEEYGYGAVYSEGRSGGWLVVEHAPDVDEYHALSLWLGFAAEIEDVIDDCRDRFLEALKAEVACRKFEASESHAMACRDIVTVQR